MRSSEPNVFEFEDLPDGGDSDFNDIVVSVSLDNAPTSNTSVTDTAVTPIIDLPEIASSDPTAIAPLTEDTDVDDVTDPVIDPTAIAPFEDDVM